MSGMIPDSFVDQVQQRVDLVQLIGQYVTLKKNGKSYTARCPFHEEKTPSFNVIPDKQFYYCFGCGVSGDASNFLMAYEHLSFPQAIEKLAQITGMTMPETTQSPQLSQQRQANQEIYRYLELAEDFFREQLRQHPTRSQAINYLKKRGLSGKICQQFGIGFAPPGWDNLLTHLATGKRDTLLEAGLITATEQSQRVYDRFRNRIIFPIKNSRGKTIAFGGRVLDDSKPKYLNSPETRVFHKSHELYGLHQALKVNRSLQHLLFVEGYMDVVALAQFNLNNAVATLGTACGAGHISLAFQHTNEIVFCFDGDSAGRRAAFKALETSLPMMQQGRQVRFLLLPDGEDPDSLIRHIGPDKFKQLSQQAIPLENFLFEAVSRDIDTRHEQGKAQLAERCRPLLAKVPTGIYGELLWKKLAQITQIPTETLKKHLSAPSSGDNYPSATKHRQALGMPGPTAENNTTIGFTYSKGKPRHYSQGQHWLERVNVGRQGQPQLLHSPENLACALLIFQPPLAQQIPTDIMSHEGEGRLETLQRLGKLLTNRPQFGPWQILGHWQASYSTAEFDEIQKLVEYCSVFNQAIALNPSDDTEFDLVAEFQDAMQRIRQKLARQRCQDIIQKLGSKPLSQLTQEERQQYREALQQQAQLAAGQKSPAAE